LFKHNLNHRSDHLFRDNHVAQHHLQNVTTNHYFVSDVMVRVFN